MTDSQFDELLDIVFSAMDNTGLEKDDIVPSVVYELISNDDMQIVWDALNIQKQEEICYDLRDSVCEGEILQRQYLKSDEYMELQYIN